MSSDPFVRERLRAAVDSESFDTERLLMLVTQPAASELRVPPGPRRRWPVAVGALAAAAAAIALAFWAISSERVHPRPVHTPNPEPTTTTPAPVAFPSGGRLVFVASVDANDPAGSLYRSRPGDETPSLLATDLGLDAASGSPDGRRVAFIVSGEASGELRVVGADGKDPRTLTTEHAPSAVTWSPDSSSLVFSAGLGGGLYRIDADGTGLRLVADPTPGCVFRDPAWSPDGSRLAFAQECASPLAVSGVGVANLEDWNPRLVARATGVLGISWSPDGSRLAYSAEGTRDHDVRVVDVASGVDRNLTGDPAEETSPAWSPDGQWIGFARDGALSVMRPDGSQVQTVPGGANLFTRSLTWTHPLTAAPPVVLPPPSGPDVQAVIPVQTGIDSLTESGGYVWTIGNERLLRVDPVTNTIDFAFGLPTAESPPGDLISDGRFGVWFTYEGAVWHFRATRHTFPEGPFVLDLPGAGDLALGGGKLWVRTTDSIVALNPSTEERLGSIPLDPACSCGSLAYLDGSLWMGDRNPVGGVDRIDPSTGQVTARIQAGSPAELVVNDGTLWVLGDPGVYEVDPATNTARQTDHIVDFEGYSGVTATSGDGRLWANGGSSGMSAGGSAVQVVDPATGHVVAVLDVFRIDMGGCSLAVTGGSLWESCGGVRTDDRGRVVGMLPEHSSYLVRIREP